MMVRMTLVHNFVTFIQMKYVLFVWTQVPLNGLRADRVCLSCGWTGQYPLYFGRGLFRSKLSVNGLLESERGSGERG